MGGSFLVTNLGLQSRKLLVSDLLSKDRSFELKGRNSWHYDCALARTVNYANYATIGLLLLVDDFAGARTENGFK